MHGSGRRVAAVGGVLGALVVAGCSVLDRDDDGTHSVSVFEVEVGDCFRAPTEDDVRHELSELDRVDCAAPHEQELYAVAAWEDPDAQFPGEETLKAFADGRCAQEFAGYVGVDYRDSSLFFTYLLPSARSWEHEADRQTLCFVTTTGRQLTASVAGSGW